MGMVWREMMRAFAGQAAIRQGDRHGVLSSTVDKKGGFCRVYSTRKGEPQRWVLTDASISAKIRLNLILAEVRA